MTRSKHELIPNIISWSDEEAVMALLEKGEVEKAKDHIFTVAPPFDPKAVDGKGGHLKNLLKTMSIFVPGRMSIWRSETRRLH